MGQASRRIVSASAGLLLKSVVFSMLKDGLSKPGSASEPPRFGLQEAIGLVVDEGAGSPAQPPASCRSRSAGQAPGQHPLKAQHSTQL